MVLLMACTVRCFVSSGFLRMLFWFELGVIISALIHSWPFCSVVWKDRLVEGLVYVIPLWSPDMRSLCFVRSDVASMKFCSNAGT